VFIGVKRAQTNEFTALASQLDAMRLDNLTNLTIFSRRTIKHFVPPLVFAPRAGGLTWGFLLTVDCCFGFSLFAAEESFGVYFQCASDSQPPAAVRNFAPILDSREVALRYACEHAQLRLTDHSLETLSPQSIHNRPPCFLGVDIITSIAY
jgi:hypothetical protein